MNTGKSVINRFVSDFQTILISSSLCFLNHSVRLMSALRFNCSLEALGGFLNIS